MHIIAEVPPQSRRVVAEMPERDRALRLHTAKGRKVIANGSVQIQPPLIHRHHERRSRQKFADRGHPTLVRHRHRVAVPHAVGLVQYDHSVPRDQHVKSLIAVPGPFVEQRVQLLHRVRLHPRLRQRARMQHGRRRPAHRARALEVGRISSSPSHTACASAPPTTAGPGPWGPPADPPSLVLAGPPTATPAPRRCSGRSQSSCHAATSPPRPCFLKLLPLCPSSGGSATRVRK